MNPIQRLVNWVKEQTSSGATTNKVPTTRSNMTTQARPKTAPTQQRDEWGNEIGGGGGTWDDGAQDGDDKKQQS